MHYNIIQTLNSNQKKNKEQDKAITLIKKNQKKCIIYLYDVALILQRLHMAHEKKSSEPLDFMLSN